MQKQRRRFLKSTAAMLSALSATRVGAASLLTPGQTAGPFYPVELPLDDDNNLVEVDGQQALAKGEHTDLSGTLLDRNGKPISGARIEIWQCDANGRYRHPRDPGPRPVDPGFQGFGHTVTDARGQYRFRTIKPVPYPGRTPHIHVAVRPRGADPFVTQLYVQGESGNSEDFLFRRIPAELRPLVVADFSSVSGNAVQRQARWDIVLGLA